jgi:hypothetical protein
MSDGCDCQFKALHLGTAHLVCRTRRWRVWVTLPGNGAQTHCSLVGAGSAGSAPGASNTVAFKRECAPRSRPASTRPKHNHAATAVLIFEEWSLANYLYPFPNAATKAQMSADTGAVSLMRVCAPRAYHMQHWWHAQARRRRRAVSLSHAALPMLTRARSACV